MAGAMIAAEKGHPHQPMSISGWLTLKDAERHAREAECKCMAGAAMGRLTRSQENKTG